MSKLKKLIGFMLAALLFAIAIVIALATKQAHSSKKQAYKVEHIVQQLPLPKWVVDNTEKGTSYWYDEEVQTGDDLHLVLSRLGVGEQSIQDFLKNSPVDAKEVQLHAGQIISVRIDSTGDLTDVQFFRDDDSGERNLVALEKVNGKWQMHVGEIDTETMPSLRSVVVTSSASGALSRAGVPVEIRTALREIFADKVDLDTLSAGDSVRVLYESLYFRGQEVATGNILAAEITKAGKTYRGYFFEHDGNSQEGNGSGNYYDENGEPLKKGFSGLPIEHYTRISSPYGIRIHPILHTIRMHTGVDYAAPMGTKILAPAEGVISFRGVKGGYGNAIMINHGNNLETLYGHMSAFVSGVQEGTHVFPGDVIGFVGATGRATGPHLHYEVRVGGQHVNPASIALPTPKLSVQDLAALKKYIQKTNATLSAVEGLPVMVSQQD